MSDDRGAADEASPRRTWTTTSWIRLRREKLDSAAQPRDRSVRRPVSGDAVGCAISRSDSAAPTDEELKGFGPVSLAGRIVTIRHHGKTCFAHLMDQTGRIQLYARADGLGDEYARFVEPRHRRLRRRDRRDVPHADG